MTITAETAEAAASGPCCDYCGLPISGAASSPAPDTAPDYCCFGCRFASQVTQERGEEGAARWALTRLGLAVFFTMNVVMVSMALWSKDWYDARDTALSATFESLLRWAALAAASPVLLLLGSSLAENAWEQMRRGRFSTDLLLLSGVLASFAYSAVSVVRGDGPIYFEVGCVVLVMVTLGRWFEATGRIKASAALDELAKLLPETVRRIDGAVETVVPLHSVRCGDRLKVLAGERFPTDGLLFETRALVDQQILTGESWPVPKSPGAAILGGSLNLDGTAYFCVSADGSQGTLARLIGLMREARLTRGRLQRLADRVTTVLFPLIALVAAGSVLWHWRASGLENGLLAGLAVTLIACPCALGLATPLAVWNALGIAARRQVLFRNGEVLERLAGVRTVCFDKTGTLTTGTPILEKLTIDPETPWTIFEREAAEIGSGSTHVFSLAIVSFLGEKSRGLPTSERAVQIVAGMGLRRISESRGEVRLGSRRFLEEAGHELPSELLEELNRAESSGSPVSLLGWDGRVRGVFQFAEQLRPEASAAIRQLQELGCNVQVLTGDHEQSARRISTLLGVSIEASLLPEDKLRSLRRTRQNGGVAMVGDGVNDAPALAASDVGIAMGCGADVSRDSAGVCLLGNDLERIPWAIGLARSTVRTIQTNLFWAFFWNLIGVAFAAAGFLNPTLAAFAMIVSSILVISNSLHTNVIDERELHSDREPSTSVRFAEFNPFEFAGNDAPADRVFTRNGDIPKEIVETVLAVPNSKRNPVAEEALS